MTYAQAINIDIEIEDDQWEEACDKALFTQVITHCVSFMSRIKGYDFNLSITLTNNYNIQTLNNKFRNKNKPTNILSFPQYDPDEPLDNLPELHLGDMVFAYETIQSEALAQNKPFQEHLKHLIVHGFLHLLGYDHVSDEEAQEMEALEIEILQEMNIKNPYIAA